MCILHTVVLGQHIADDKQVGSCVHPVTYQVPLGRISLDSRRYSKETLEERSPSIHTGNYVR
jgi:hypothetical protein